MLSSCGLTPLVCFAVISLITLGVYSSFRSFREQRSSFSAALWARIFMLRPPVPPALLWKRCVPSADLPFCLVHVAVLHFRFVPRFVGVWPLPCVGGRLSFACGFLLGGCDVLDDYSFFRSREARCFTLGVAALHYLGVTVFLSRPLPWLGYFKACALESS